jgi:hypothetical protein
MRIEWGNSRRLSYENYEQSLPHDRTDLEALPSPSMQVYISKRGQRYGPYCIEELRQQLDSNVFTGDDFATI